MEARFNQRVCLPDVINSKSPGKTGRNTAKGVGWKTENDAGVNAAVIFGVYHISQIEGASFRRLRLVDGVKSWISRPICTSFHSYFFLRLRFPRCPRTPTDDPYPSSLLNRSSVKNARSALLLFSSWPFSDRQEIVRVLGNVNVQPLALSGRP